MEHVYLTGLFSILLFVSIYVFQHELNGTRQIENNWNPNKSRTAGGRFSSSILFSVVSHLRFLDSPEISPGVLITASSSSAPTTTGTSQDSTATGASSPNTGLIIAGAVGGVTGIAVIIIAVVVIFFLQRRRARASSDVVAAITEDTAPFAVGSGAQPRNRGNNALSDDVIPEPPTALMGVYVSEFVPSFSTSLFILSCLVLPEPE